MKLCSFGDSFIFGTDLEDCGNNSHSNLTWPALIAKNLNLDYECYAKPGCGNRYILNQLLDHTDVDCFYIIQWTWIDRYDYNFNDIWQTVRPSLDNKKTDEFYYKNFHSELHDKQVTLGLIYQAVCALEWNNCKYLMTYIDPLMLDKKWHCPPGVQFLQDRVSSSLSSVDNDNFLGWARSKNYSISKSWHPLEEAHTKFSDIWTPKVRTLLNNSAKEESNAFE